MSRCADVGAGNAKSEARRVRRSSLFLCVMAMNVNV
jgi:hypothetical protein